MALANGNGNGRNGFTLIDESYNASPEAVRAALATLALASPDPGGRRIAVLGDMRELGDEADAIHAARNSRGAAGTSSARTATTFMLAAATSTTKANQLTVR